MNAGFGNQKGAKRAVLKTGILRFDQLTGAVLVRLVYFFDLAGLALGTVVARVSGFSSRHLGQARSHAEPAA